MRNLHLDTDIGGDIDDLCALAMVLNWPESELVAVTTVSDSGGKRAGYVRYVLEIAGRRDVSVAAGADISLGCYHHWQPGFHPDESAYWPERVPPAPGPAADAIDLLERSIQANATIAAVGPYTNLAILISRHIGHRTPRSDGRIRLSSEGGLPSVGVRKQRPSRSGVGAAGS
jgi:purine nucleosidase